MSNPYNTDGMLNVPGFKNYKPITMNAMESIECTIAFDVRDWAADRRSAWIFAIIFGWGDPLEDEAWNELSQKFCWDKEDLDRALVFHRQWIKAKEFLEEELERTSENEERQENQSGEADAGGVGIPGNARR